jgi:general secretion pathway protein I
MTRRQSGFTLLEMMVALSILAGGLFWLVQATTGAIAAENHAKLTTTATFLARQRLVELEDELQEKGFTDDAFAKETSGSFDDKGFKRFTWTTVIDKIELPNTDQVQTMVSQGMQNQGVLSNLPGAPPAASQGSSGSSSSSSGTLGGSAGALAGQFGIIKDVLEQSIRRARVRVSWVEGSRATSLEVTEYLTDPKKVDQSIQLGSMLGGGAPGQNQPGVGGSGTPGVTPSTGGTSGGAGGSPLQVTH